MTKRAAFTQSDVRRALRGLKAAGVEVEQMEVEIDLTTGRMLMRPAPARQEIGSDNVWDEVLRK